MLTGKHIVTLLEQPGRQGRVDVGAERRLKSLPVSQTRLHAVERRRQRAEVVILHHRQALAEITGRNTLSSCGEIANGLQEWRVRGPERRPDDEHQYTTDHHGEGRAVLGHV